MLITKEVQMKITSRNRPYYKEKGYDTTQEIVSVKVDDLPSGSHYDVEVKCDYCGETTTKNYRHYLKQRETIEKDACRKCTYLKEKDLWGEENVRKRRGHCKGRLVYSYEFVKNCVESEGFTLLTKRDEYVDFESKITYLCGNPNHKPVSVRARMFVMYNHRCQACYHESLKGENSPNWKGGKAETKAFFRVHLRDWVRKSFEAYNYTCPVTGISGYSEVHHIKPFATILDEAFSELNVKYKPSVGDYEQDVIDNLLSIVLQKHEALLGVPLYKPVHKLLHSLYGKETSESDYEEFIERCKNGDLKEEIEEIVLDFNKEREQNKDDKRVVCLNTGISYSTKTQASKETGIPISTITKSINFEKPIKGVRWMKEIDLNKEKK